MQQHQCHVVGFRLEEAEVDQGCEGGWTDSLREDAEELHTCSHIEYVRRKRDVTKLTAVQETNHT